jgi:hypothetical protein
VRSLGFKAVALIGKKALGTITCGLPSHLDSCPVKIKYNCEIKLMGV